MTHLPFDQTRLTDAQARNIERLLLLAGELGLTVEWADLGPKRRGEYEHRRRTVRLNVRLQGFQVEVTLGHELAHALFGDDRYGVPELEARARRVGALLTAR